MKRLVLLAPLLAACGGDDAPPCDRTVAGNICTVVGNGNSGYAGDDGLAIDATMSLPQDMLAMPDGSMLVIDWNNHRIRKVGEDGMIHHVAGRGELFGPDDDPNESDLNHPTALLLDDDRLLIAAWHNSKVRQLPLDSDVVTDLGGDGRRAYFGDGGPALTASFDLPASLAFDPDDNVIVMDQANQVLRMIDPDGMVHPYAGRCVIEPAGACDAPVACPAPSGKTTCGDPAMTCGMPCTPGYGGDEGPATEMRMAQPFGQSADPAGRIVFDPDGNLYFADTTNGLIRMIDTDGVVHRVAGTPPEDGVPQVGHDGDGGPALDATLYNPVDLALAGDGTLYFTDVYNHCVRAIDPGGDISTVVGVCGEDGYDGDGGPADVALLKRPYGLELDGDTLYIADTGNNVVRAVLLPSLLALLLGACGDDPTPDFPADYAATFDEVRDCRPSGDHDLHNVRVVADPAARPAYLGRDQPFPEGAIILKEEYDFADDACAGEIVDWTVMTKLDGSPATLGWKWQRVAADRTVTSEDDSRCIGCHEDCGVPPDGYDGTCEVP